MADARRRILGLVAAGRITAAEAERLLAAWNDGREWMWIALACVAICAIGIHPQNVGWLDHARVLVTGVADRLAHAAVSVVTKGMGGTL